VAKSNTFTLPLNKRPAKEELLASFSVVCPVYNEVDYIDGLLEFIEKASLRPKEIFVVDGGSTDGTLEKLSKWKEKLPELRVLHNPHRYVPHALNKAIPLCSGDYIVRLDAHTEYAPDYFEKILHAFQKSGADIVGGPTRTKGASSLKRAISYTISTKMGIGDSRVHQEDYEGLTDSVTFGAWKKDIFSVIGFFDVRLRRNQDDEFHYRAKSKGLKIFQSPAICLYYHPRSSLQALFSQYFQYGFYKPMVLKKVPSEMKWRHLIPAAFVLYLFGLVLGFWWHIVFLFPLSLYFLLVLSFSLFNDLPLKSRLWCILVYPTLHIAYGLGFLLGIRKIL